MLRSILTEHLPQKAIALVIAITLVSLKREDALIVRSTMVRVRVNVPDDRVLVSPRTVDKVRISMEGKAGPLGDTDLDSIPDLQLPLTGLEGGQVTFEPDMFTGVPRDVRIVSIRPPAMLVQFEEKVTSSVSLEPVFDGEPARGFRVTQWSVDPPKITVEGAKSAVERLTKVKTRAIPLADTTQSKSVKTTLAAAPRFVGFLGPHSVRVTIQVEEKTGTRVVIGRPIEVRGVAEGAPGFEVSPPTVDVTLYGPTRLLDELKVDTLVAYVDASKISPRRKLLTRKVSFEAPKGLKSSELKPGKVTLLRRDPAPPSPPEEEPE